MTTGMCNRCLTHHMRPVIHLGWSQLAVVTSGVGTVLMVVGIAFMPQLEELYVREFLLPRMADRYGFRIGMLQVSHDGHSCASHGIVSVRPDGAMARLGVRAADIPFAFHGNGAAAMYHALMAGERGQPAEFDVVNAADWSAGQGRSAFRTIRVQPHGRER